MASLPTTSPRWMPPASTARRWRPRACACSTRRCSATTSSMPMRTPATSGSTAIRRARPIRASSRWISASWASSRSEDQYYLAENFMAIFNKDYRRIAELHVEAGWMPAHHAHRRTGSGGALGLRAVLHPAAVGNLAGRSADQAVPHRAEVRTDPAAAVDPAAEDPAEHRGRRPPAGSAARHLGGGQAGAGAHPAGTLQPAARRAGIAQAPAGDHDPRARTCRAWCIPG